MSIETINKIEAEFKNLGFEKQRAKGKRVYIQTDALIKDCVITFSIDFNKSLNCYNVSGLVLLDNVQIFKDKRTTSEADFDKFVENVKNNMMYSYHKRIETLVQKAGSSISDYKAVQEVVSKNIPLPEGYQAVAKDCYKTSVGWRTIYSVARMLKSSVKKYLLIVDSKGPIELGAYVGRTKHYSEEILELLVSDYGWVWGSNDHISAVKDVGGGTVGGQLNPNGARKVYASFDETGRYLKLQHGFDDIFDLDCRGHSVEDAAKLFSNNTNNWADNKIVPTKGINIPDSNIGRTWNSIWGTQKIIGIYGGNLYEVRTIGLDSVRRYPIKDIEQIIKKDEYRLTPEYEKEKKDDAEISKLKQERKDKQDALRAKAEAEIAEYCIYKGMARLPATKVRVTLLDMPINVKGKSYTRKDLIEKEVAEGASVQDSYEGRRLVAKDNSFWDQRTITKTGMDYAEYLISKRDSTADKPTNQDISGEEESHLFGKDGITASSSKELLAKFKKLCDNKQLVIAHSGRYDYTFKNGKLMKVSNYGKTFDLASSSDRYELESNFEQNTIRIELVNSGYGLVKILYTGKGYW